MFSRDLPERQVSSYKPHQAKHYLKEGFIGDFLIDFYVLPLLGTSEVTLARFQFFWLLN